MLTLFTIPKPFVGHIGIIQRNAIASWARLNPKPEIVLFGDEPGTGDVAREHGVRHEPTVVRNEFGTPLVSDVFARAGTIGAHDLQCYVNADILLLADFLDAVRRVAARWRNFLLVGGRWDLDVPEPLDFSSGWEGRLRRLVASAGRLHAATGMDYFVFRRGLWGDIPPFAVGRTMWDNWLLYGARARRAPLIDGTRAITAVHQNHGYAHFAGGADSLWKGPEARRNLQLAGGYGNAFTLSDATWRLGPRSLAPAVTNYHRRLWAFPRRVAHRWLFRRSSQPA